MGIWKNYVVDAEKKADPTVPCGEYDVVITDIKRKTSSKNPNSEFCMVVFGNLPEGEVPAVCLFDHMHTGTPSKDAWLRKKACHVLDDIAASIGVNLDDYPDIDLDDPVYDAATRLINRTLRVQVIENPNTLTGKETIPIVPSGI